MNDIELLTQLRADIPEADPEMLERTRARLLPHGEPTLRLASRPPLRSRTRRRIVVVAGLAAAITAGAVGLNVTSYHHKPITGASAEAAALLNAAADNAARASDPPLKRGQYGYVRTHAWYGSENLDTGGYYLREQLIEEWFSPDGTEDIRTTGPIALRFFDPAYERHVRATQPNELVKTVDFQRGLSADPNPEWIASLPLNDPKALLAKIDENEDQADSAQKRYDYEFSWISDFLRSGLVGPRLRAAIYRATATIPGVFLVDRTANLDGHRGVAIGRNDIDGVLRHEFIFDAPGGEYIGERVVMIAPNCTPWTGNDHQAHNVCLRVPLGTIFSSTAVSISVVDGKPER